MWKRRFDTDDVFIWTSIPEAKCLLDEQLRAVFFNDNKSWKFIYFANEKKTHQYIFHLIQIFGKFL